MSADTSESILDHITPTTLALLEDTGWYVANFTQSRKSSFGIGAGCNFVNEQCIVEGNVPPYSEGIFCNTTDLNELRCDPSHRTISNCNMKDFSSSFEVGPGPEMQYFSNAVRSELNFSQHRISIICYCHSFPHNVSNRILVEDSLWPITVQLLLNI